MSDVVDVPRITYSRGIGECLQKEGHIQMPSGEMLKQACDEAAQHIETYPLEATPTPEEHVKVANHLIQINDNLKQQGKTASFDNRPSMAQTERGVLGDVLDRVKQAAGGEVSNENDKSEKTITDDDDPKRNNTPQQAEKYDPATKMDQDRRPEGKYNVGQGNTNFNAPQSARQGKEQPHPDRPEDTSPVPETSAEEASMGGSEKMSSFADKIRKMGQEVSNKNDKSEKTITDDDDPKRNNTPQQSAQYDPNTKMDQDRRPEGKYNVGQGNTNFEGVPANARQGMEQDHPKQPNDVSSAPKNSAERVSKSAQFNEYFEKTANEVVPNLPNGMTDQQKIATVKQCMGLTPEERNQYLQKVAHQHDQNSVGNLIGNLGQ